MTAATEESGKSGEGGAFTGGVGLSVAAQLNFILRVGKEYLPTLGNRSSMVGEQEGYRAATALLGLVIEKVYLRKLYLVVRSAMQVSGLRPS